MQFPRESVVCFFLFWILSFFSVQKSHAIQESQPLHFSGDKQVWDRKANRVELFGRGAVTQVGETLTADYILLDLNARTLDARGNCVYIVSNSVIWGEEMHFNLDTRTGTVVGGRISTDSFTLRGDRINKLGDGRFQTHWGDYTTCRDCSPSWSLQGEDVDMEIEGYAYLTNVTTRVKDAPAFWLPYMVLPMKARRQTGFLFPVFASTGSSGASYILPFFWAINRSSDMTISLGEFTGRGHRAEVQGRYNLGGRNTATANFYYLTDRVFNHDRWAFDIEQVHDLPFGIEEKLRFTEISDNLYPFTFGSDIPRAYLEAVLPSSLSFSRSSADVSAFVTFQRNRNLVNSATAGDPISRQRIQETQFDPRTVQALPTAVVTTNDKMLWNTPFTGGLTLGFSNFSRSASPFDFDSYTDPTRGPGVPFGTAPPLGLLPRPGIDPIREATRVSVTPSVYTTFRVFDEVSVVPSLQYRQYFYNFNTGNPNLQVPSLSRGYLLFQTDLFTQLERIYEFPDDPDVPRAKHLIRPLLTYSLIPMRDENKNHPFVSQFTQGQPGRPFTPGYNFDNNDIIPYTYQQTSANYFAPLGNSIAYGFSTQWIRRRGRLDSEYPTYKPTVEFSAGQSLNFLEMTDPVDPQNSHVLSRYFSTLNLDFDHFNWQTTYYYYPDVFPVSSRNTVSTGATYILEQSLHQRVLTFERSFNLTYTYNKINAATSNLTGRLLFSISDYVFPTADFSYGFEPDRALYGGGLGLGLQSPSRCWKLTTGLRFARGQPGLSFTVDLALNLTGSGFGGVTELASQAMSH